MNDLSSLSGKLFLLNLIALVYVANEQLRLQREKMTVQPVDLLLLPLVISLIYLLIPAKKASRVARPHEGPNQFFNLLNHDVGVPAAGPDPELPADGNQQDPQQIIRRSGPRTQVP